MKPAWRGVVAGGVVWAWPTVLMTHAAALVVLPLPDISCRWRQWAHGAAIDFDEGCSDADKALVEAWVKAASV